MSVSLDCCVCGGGAGRWKQHWNRDSGYGICAECVAFEASTLTAEELEENYGKPGVNYGQPMVTFQGRRYKVLAATKHEDVANAFMERVPNASVLTVFDNGVIVLADKEDQGEPIAVEPQKELT